MFARKFYYDNFSWPCFEDKSKLIAAFKFKYDSYRIRLSPDQKFFNRQKAVWSSDGFFADKSTN